MITGKMGLHLTIIKECDCAQLGYNIKFRVLAVIWGDWDLFWSFPGIGFHGDSFKWTYVRSWVFCLRRVARRQRDNTCVHWCIQGVIDNRRCFEKDKLELALCYVKATVLPNIYIWESFKAPARQNSPRLQTCYNQPLCNFFIFIGGRGGFQINLALWQWVLQIRGDL